MATLIPKFDLMNGGLTPLGAINRPINQKLSELISIKDFGAIGDGSVDDTNAIQLAINYCSTTHQELYIPVGKYLIRSTLTTPDNGYIYLIGESAVVGDITNYTEFSTFFFAPSGADTVLLSCGKLNNFSFSNMVFATADYATAYSGVKIGTLGGGIPSQSASQSLPFVINQCNFRNFGKTGLSLGGETYGVVQNSLFFYCTQSIAVNGAGEIAFESCFGIESPNASFTPGTSNGDGWVYIYDTVTRWNNCVFTTTANYRPYFYVQECNNFFWSGGKNEASGATSLNFDFFKIQNDTNYGRVISIYESAMTASSATGSFNGRFIKTYGTLPVRVLNFNNCSATYGSGVSSGTPLLDVTVNKPLMINVSGIYREAADNPIIKFASGANDANNSVMLAGLVSTQIQFVTYTSPAFTIAAGQTSVDAPIGQTSRLYYYGNTLVQILPVSISVSTDAAPGDIVSFFLSTDPTGLDKARLGAADYDTQTWFPIRGLYIPSPSFGTLSTGLKYTSGASASVSTKYYVTFVYAIIQDQVTSPGGAYFVST